MPWFVTAFGVLCATLGLCMMLIFGAGVKSALAFTVDGEWYPDSLGGYTVTMNSHITSPPVQLTQKWIWVQCTTVGTTTAGNNPAVSLYYRAETKQQAGNSHPWFWFMSTTKDYQASPPAVSGYAYSARYGYDGETGVAAWWNINNRPEITFIDEPQRVPLADVNLTYGVTDHDFIIYIVENSDFRTRYSGGTWVQPTVAVVMNGIAWVQDENNAPSSMEIRYSQTASFNTYTVVYSENPASYAGSYVAPQTGYYQIVFNYSINNVQHQDVQDLGQITVVVPSQLSFGAYHLTHLAGNTYRYEGAIYYAERVVLQYAENDAMAEWHDTNVSFQVPDSTYPNTWTSSVFTALEGYKYRLVAYDANGNDETLLLGVISEGSDGDSEDWFTDVWEDAWRVIQNIFNTFSAIFGSLFFWLPPELTAFLLAFLTVLIVLGVISKVI